MDHGLFAYPVLMAADILLYNADRVPVGQDQKQHLEMTRDIATKFNLTYGQVFTLPEPQILDDVAVVPGIDGRKMSKSYGNTIRMFDDEKAIRRAVMAIVTDSTPVASPVSCPSCRPISRTNPPARVARARLPRRGPPYRGGSECADLWPELPGQRRLAP